jgi:hypothetical protein
LVITNRRRSVPRGSCLPGSNPCGPHDRHVGRRRSQAERRRRRLLAVLVQRAGHPVPSGRRCEPAVREHDRWIRLRRPRRCRACARRRARSGLSAASRCFAVACTVQVIAPTAASAGGASVGTRRGRAQRATIGTGESRARDERAGDERRLGCSASSRRPPRGPTLRKLPDLCQGAQPRVDLMVLCASIDLASDDVDDGHQLTAPEAGRHPWDVGRCCVPSGMSSRSTAMVASFQSPAGGPVVA